MESVDTLPARPRCSYCRRYYSVDFFVPDAMWALVVHEAKRANAACLVCFTMMADERLVRWDEDIEFRPISLERQRIEVLSRVASARGGR